MIVLLFLPNFNSKMVRLKEKGASDEQKEECHFNSKMVRLKDYLVTDNRGKYAQFQFQDGAIKSMLKV